MRRLLRDKRAVVYEVIVGFTAIFVFSILWYSGLLILLPYWTDMEASGLMPMQGTLLIMGMKSGYAILAIIVDGGLLFWILLSAMRREDISQPR